MPNWDDYGAVTSPDDADTFLEHDVSEVIVGQKMKKITWANIKATLKTYLDTLYIAHSLATAVSDFLVASASGTFAKKTLAETRAILEPGLINGQGATLTIASGVITPTHKFHLIDTEASGATDDVTDIAGTNAAIGDILTLSSVNNSRDPTIVTGAGTIRLPANVTMSTILVTVMLSWDGTRWRGLSSSVNV